MYISHTYTHMYVHVRIIEFFFSRPACLPSAEKNLKSWLYGLFKTAAIRKAICTGNIEAFAKFHGFNSANNRQLVIFWLLTHLFSLYLY